MVVAVVVKVVLCVCMCVCVCVYRGNCGSGQGDSGKPKRPCDFILLVMSSGMRPLRIKHMPLDLVHRR